MFIHQASLGLGLLLLSGLLVGCSTEPENEVGLGTGDGSGLASATTEPPMIDVQSTAIPSQWPSDIPAPPGGRVDSVVVLDERISVTWIAPLEDIYDLTGFIYDGFEQADCDERTSDVTDNYGKVECASGTRTVTIDITPLGADEAQVLATYQPLP